MLFFFTDHTNYTVVFFTDYTQYAVLVHYY